MSCCGGSCSCGKREKAPAEEYNLLVQIPSTGNRLDAFDWTLGPDKLSVKEAIVEIRFKSKRKAFYRNRPGLELSIDDRVVVEIDGGYDLGTVSLMGSRAEKKFDEKAFDIQKIRLYRVIRKANMLDLEKWLEAKRRERTVLLEARNIATIKGLDVNIIGAEVRADGRQVKFTCFASGEANMGELSQIYSAILKMDVVLLRPAESQSAVQIKGD